jgi:hypothetical protein
LEENEDDEYALLRPDELENVDDEEEVWDASFPCTLLVVLATFGLPVLLWL